MARYVLRQHVYDALQEYLKEQGREDLLAGALELTEITDPNPDAPDEGEEIEDADGADEYGFSISQEAAHDH